MKEEFEDELELMAVDWFEHDRISDSLNMIETCDWCGSAPVIYKDEAFSLCENCRDQLFGD